MIKATSKISDGNMSFNFEDKDVVLDNRKNFLDKYGLKVEDSVVIQSLHKDLITKVTEKDKGLGVFSYDDAVPTEALITNEQNLVLCLVTADCFPIFYHDPVKQVISIAHCGWRPTTRNLAKKVLEKMNDLFDCEFNDIKVHIGPGIQKDSYVFKNPEQEKYKEWSNFLEKIPSGETKIDLQGFIVNQLLSSGIEKENLTLDNIDTAKSDDYYSHYISEKTGVKEGRFLNIIALK